MATTRSELQRIGVGAPTSSDLEDSRSVLESAETEHRAVQAERDTVAALTATRESEHQRAESQAAQNQEELAAHERDARPHEERWRRLEALAREHGVLSATRAARLLEAFTGLGSPNLSTRARSEGSKLVERSRTAQRADEVRARVESWIEAEEDRSGEGYLETWLAVLEWLRHRLPAHIAEVDDSMEALARLKEELVGLEERLRGQEQALRGTSADVASHIDVQIRRQMVRSSG